MTAQYLRTQAKRLAARQPDATLLADILGLDLGVA